LIAAMVMPDMSGLLSYVELTARFALAEGIYTLTSWGRFPNHGNALFCGFAPLLSIINAP